MSGSLDRRAFADTSSRRPSPDFIITCGLEQDGVRSHDGTLTHFKDALFTKYLAARREDDIIPNLDTFKVRLVSGKINISPTQGHALVNVDTIPKFALAVDHHTMPAVFKDEIFSNGNGEGDFGA